MKPETKKRIFLLSAIAAIVVVILAILVVREIENTIEATDKARKANEEWADWIRSGSPTPIDENDTPEERRKKRMMNNMRIYNSNLSDEEKIQESLKSYDEEYYNSNE